MLDVCTRGRPRRNAAHFRVDWEVPNRSVPARIWNTFDHNGRGVSARNAFLDLSYGARAQSVGVTTQSVVPVPVLQSSMWRSLQFAYRDSMSREIRSRSAGSSSAAVRYTVFSTVDFLPVPPSPESYLLWRDNVNRRGMLRPTPHRLRHEPATIARTCSTRRSRRSLRTPRIRPRSGCSEP